MAELSGFFEDCGDGSRLVKRWTLDDPECIRETINVVLGDLSRVLEAKERGKETFLQGLQEAVDKVLGISREVPPVEG